MNKVICQFCKNTISSDNPSSSFLESFICRNHKDITVSFVYNKMLSDIDYYSIYNFVDPTINKYQIFIMIDGMFIHHNFLAVKKLPLDLNLTPENYNQKLKTYLTFM